MKRTLISKWKKSNKKYRIIFVLLKHLSSQTKILPQSLIFSMVNAMATAVFAIQYGNTGCGVFKGGIQIWKCFWLTINCSIKTFASKFVIFNDEKFERFG